MIVDKDQLAKAVKLANKGAKAPFYIEHQFSSASVLKSLHFLKLGTIPVPISLKNINRLKKVCEPALAGIGLNRQSDPEIVSAREVDGGKISCLPSSFLSSALHNIANAGLEHLGFPLNRGMRVEPQLDKFMLFEVGDHQSCHFNHDSSPGTVGTIVLHLPVEGGHQGGRLSLVHSGKVKSFYSHTESHKRFSFWTFYNTCQQVLEPISEGAMALLVFRLVWINAPTDKVMRQLSIPAFLESVMDINDTLRPWNSLAPGLTSASDESDKSSDYNSSGYSDSSDSEMDSRMECHPVRDEEGLFFMLKHQYSLDGWSFSSLKEEDRVLAMQFQSCPAAEVHLAMVTQVFKQWQPADNDSCVEDHGVILKVSLHLSNWIHPDGPVHLTGLDRFLCGRLVGKEEELRMQPARDPDQIKKIEQDDPEDGIVEELSYITPVLFVWPRKRATAMYCAYGFDSLLDTLECSSEGLDTLRQMVDFIKECPDKAWRDPATGGADRAERLLRLCIKFHAKEEGLKLLELLNVDFSNRGVKTFEGLRDDRVAEAIADFECHVGGWEACSRPILGMTSNASRIENQLLSFLVLIQQLIKVACFTGAIQVEQAVTSILHSFKSLKLMPSQLDSYFDLSFEMEANPKTAHPKRIPRLQSFFRHRLDTFQQSRLLVRLADQHLRKPSFLELLGGLVTNGDFGDSPRLKEVAVELLICSLKTNRTSLVDKLVIKLMEVPHLLQAVLASPNIWSLAAANWQGKAQLVAILPILVKTRMACLVALAERNPVPSSGSSKDFSDFDPNWQEHMRKVDAHREQVRRSLASGLRMVIRLVGIIGLSDSEGLRILAPLLYKMSRERLCHLVVDVYQCDDGRWGSTRLFAEVCRRVRLPDKLEPDIAIALMKVFIHQGSDVLEPLIDWLTTDSSDLLGAVIRRSSEWSTKSSGSADLMKKILSKLVRAWIPALTSSGSQAQLTAGMETLIRLEQNSLCPPIAESWSALVGKLTSGKLLDLLLDLQTDLSKRQGLKSMALYRELVSSFLQRKDGVEQVRSPTTALELLKCLLWLDYYSGMKLYVAMLSNVPNGDLLVIELALSEEFRRHVVIQSASSDIVFVTKYTCLSLIDHCLEWLGHFRSAGSEDWKQNKALVPGYPEVQTFLRSNRRDMVQRGFIRVAEAREFAEKLLRDAPSNGYAVRTEVKGAGKASRVEIVKILMEPHQCNLANQCNDEQQDKVDALLALRDRLNQKEGGAKRPALAADDGVNESKRMKC